MFLERRPVLPDSRLLEQKLMCKEHVRRYQQRTGIECSLSLSMSNHSVSETNEAKLLYESSFQF
jgi:hypothetical protein